MDYEQAQEMFLTSHLAARSGERLGRLKRGYGHAEKLFLQNVWWPLRGDFVHLHPEYEVLDWRGRSYFADFAYLPGAVKLLFEIKGYAAHVRDMDRQKYSHELNRETFLYGMGYQVLSFAYDDVEQRPELCITLLRLALSRHQTISLPEGRMGLLEKEIMRFVVGQGGRVRPKTVADFFALDSRRARTLLSELSVKGWLVPVKKGEGIRNVEYALGREIFYYWD
ncbi:hypothetical protein [Paenibacillus sp. NPDC058177]|uniref:hypothetical protein n=1 Tax=Paenibacillus sp. NPDC058177 TaxID=3346369 RepID=UPI0036D81CD4